MPKLDIVRTISIDRSASDAWDIIFDDFENTYTYLSTVKHGEPIIMMEESSSDHNNDGGLANSKGVTGRLVWPQDGPGPVAERFTEINKEEWNFTHDVVGMPSAMGFKKGTVFLSWSLKELGPTQCELTLHMVADMYVFPGVIFKPLFTKFGFGPVLQTTVEDVRYFIEHGEPSPAKMEVLKKHPYKNPNQEQARQ